MAAKNRIYRKLQKHLDGQVVGFPAAANGSDIRLLKHIFTPEEAEIVCCLSHNFESVDRLFPRAKFLVDTPEILERILHRIQKKGGIESRIRDGRYQYCNAPLVVGMYEMQMERMSPEFLKDFDDYTASMGFGMEFLGTKLPQMRTIPVKKSIPIENHVAGFDEISTLMARTDGPFVIVTCICRKKQQMQGRPCRVTRRTETCLALGDIAATCLSAGMGREISREEAVAILDKNQKQGLVLQPSNTVKPEFICSCCGCCCGMLSLHQKLPKPLEFQISNFQAGLDKSLCNGCGVCEQRCQVNAVKLAGDPPRAELDLNLCLGCGVCVTTCSPGALGLVKKKRITRPPEDREKLHAVLLENRKGPLGKATLAGKLLKDMVQTGRTLLLK
ncbi:4Fe-4S dicluster domain-containing protein [Desulfocicer vacuolatum DSM 3385]|uniref:4Fe-4S dicluster domain-containing protein n=1 Tax=Desulfocicer vacuolatum DSM 3385 TaxID=1121400 RepID=A0A1W2D1G7_9BACT|nr:4Fe-4S binding protein [Desulfocicer vacuolatum]SMC90882.1 4Fe-4S dicluster domain-containing protein [Desulfocicer vacuolatum DSM 3385]